MYILLLYKALLYRCEVQQITDVQRRDEAQIPNPKFTQNTYNKQYNKYILEREALYNTKQIFDDRESHFFLFRH